ncbi:LysR substrate-binding domain-containing protein [Streptomyces niveiscabiei]|uniref:LysR substrate-binding domain-containing protein n=2 Tax=Streptomyces TaxID=1883 RepID=A0ABW9HU65_9ACTN
MRDEHRELRLFLHLTQSLNFGRTSLDCHVSPATLTRTVQRLETDLGHRLFDRGPRGVALTAEGHRFREYAVQALELWRAYREERPDPAQLTGRLSVFATVTACQALLPDLLAPFRAAHPQVRLDLRTGDAAAALARLDEGDADVAVAGIPERLPEGLASRTVARTELVFVTRRGAEGRAGDAGAADTEGQRTAREQHADGQRTTQEHPEPTHAEGQRIGGEHPPPARPPHPGNPLTAPFVLPQRGLVREAADRWFRTQGVTPEIACEPDGHEALLTLVALGCGTGVVPRLVLEHSAVRDRLAVVPATPQPAPLTVGLCVRRADLRRPVIAALWSLTALN